MPADARPITFSVQAGPRSRSSWLALATRVEAEGFTRLYCADHPGSGAAPLVALAAAAAATTTIELGPLVLNAGLRAPSEIASGIASLDVVSDGRAILGMGAGHTPSEWADRGLAYPSAAARVDACLAAVERTTQILASPDFRPRPARAAIPLLMGGNGRRLLRYAAGHADIISMTGLGATLADGHRHAIRWRRSDIEARLEIIDAGLRDRRTGQAPPVLEALVQRVLVTDDAAAAAAQLLGELEDHAGLSEAELIASPYALVGTAPEIAAKLRRMAADTPITSFVVREGALDQVAQIRAALDPA